MQPPTENDILRRLARRRLRESLRRRPIRAITETRRRPRSLNRTVWLLYVPTRGLR